jgi:DNA-binding NarL/FixJ family response regulator
MPDSKARHTLIIATWWRLCPAACRFLIARRPLPYPREGTSMVDGLVGRAGELATLVGILNGDDLVPSAIEVAGEPGIGKTRLLREFAGMATGRGHRVWYGRATQYERTTPFDLLLHAIGGYEREPGLAAFKDQRPAESAALASIIPAFAAGAGVPLPLAEERHHLYRAIGSLLEWASAGHGLVVVLDDVHWADAETVQWLRYLLRRPLPERVSVIVAHRHGSLSAELAMALAQARADGVLSRMELRPLALADVASLMVYPHDRRELEELHRASGGNPLYLLILLHRREAAGMPWSRQPGFTDPADSLRAAVLAEIESLPADARLFARAAAVAGDPFDLVLAATIAPLDESPARAALDVLAACGLVHRDQQAGGFAFRHPLVREVIYSHAGEGWLIDAHSRAVEYLSGLSLPATRLADHAERCARPGDRRLAGVLSEAGRSVMGHAPHTAAHWLSAALRLLPTGSGAVGELELRLDLAYSLGASGQFDRGWEALVPLVTRSGLPGGASRHKALLVASLLERHLGRTDTARQALSDELERPGDTRSRCALVIELCYHHLMHGDIAAHAKCAQEGLLLARDCGDRLKEAAAEAQLALAELAQGNVDAAVLHRDVAAGIIDRAGDDQLLDDLDACCQLASGELQLEMFSEARARVDRVARLAHAAGRGIVMIQATALRALILRQVGDFDEAWRHAEEALEMVRSTGSERWRLTILAVRGELALLRGDPEEAIANGTEALGLGTTAADKWLTRQVPTILAVAKFFAGRQDGCTEQILSAYGGADLPNLDAAVRVRVYETLTWMDAVGLDLEAASGWAERATQASANIGLPSAEGFAHLARAQAILFATPVIARQHARLAMAAFRGTGARYEACRAQLIDAIATLVHEGPDVGGRLLAEAKAALASCGAQLPASFTSGLPTATDPLAALSPRELQVATLVSEGHTNRQIARALSMSEKTVETHMSRIFSKLSVGNRAAVASLIGRRPLKSPADLPQPDPCLSLVT